MWPFTPRPRTDQKPRRRTGQKSFHVLVEWPGTKQPWLVWIEAASAREARLIIETSTDIRRGRGKVISVEDAAAADS